MVFINLRRILLLALFFAGSGVLFLGYSGLTGTFINDSSKTAKTVDQKANQAIISAPIVKESGSEEVEGFFVQYRMQREKARGQQLEILKEIVENPSTADDTKKVAQEQLLAISTSIVKEAKIENLLKAKGYRDVVVCVDQKGVTVVVDKQALSTDEEGKVIEIVSKETGFGEQGIVVMPKNKQNDKKIDEKLPN